MSVEAWIATVGIAIVVVGALIRHMISDYTLFSKHGERLAALEERIRKP
jgi:hypothetical protein